MVHMLGNMYWQDPGGKGERESWVEGSTEDSAAKGRIIDVVLPWVMITRWRSDTESSLVQLCCSSGAWPGYTRVKVVEIIRHRVVEYKLV